MGKKKNGLLRFLDGLVEDGTMSLIKTSGKIIASIAEAVEYKYVESTSKEEQKENYEKIGAVDEHKQSGN